MGSERIAIVGNGIIGHGTAQVFAMAGHPVTMIGRNPQSLEKAIGRIKASLKDFVAHGIVSSGEADAAVGRVAVSTVLEDAKPADFVLEAVTEDLDLKIGIFARLDATCRPEAILASSSGQPASALVPRVARKERVIAAHFWYPPQLIPLVEVCGGPHCAREVVDRTVDLIRRAGKHPVVIDKEVKGFIGNRLQFALLREAWALWADGVAAPEVIDAVVRMSFGRRLGVTGPIESADVGGLATMYNFSRFLQPDLSTAPEPPQAVAQTLAKQQGAGGWPGLYDWSRRDRQALVDARMKELFRWLAEDRRKAAR
ncbi:MAG: 3-hydroxyacyl-CoA dehydrogenase family protein [Alphaproteobacteria bacterium]|nr:3-hydroxyacyl-CoA dehydrogenase family protein [Alphaproteobacteria bacterium]